MTERSRPADRAAEAGAAERVIYRDAESFNKALDAASESIRQARGPDVVGQAIWWGLLALLALLYGSDWILGWNLRAGLGFDLAKPVWLALAGLMVYHHVWTRNRHARIIAQRLCLRCGHGLLAIDVDTEGNGACPRCGRAFNLGEYRRPQDNRGRSFRGYLDRDHFDKAMYAAAEHLRSRRGLGLEGDLLGWAWLALGISFGLSLLGWDVLEWIPGPIPVYGFWFIIMMIWSAIHSARVRRLQPVIVRERLCLGCGFCLTHTPTDRAGVGRCPECGAEFVRAQYVRPRVSPTHEDEAGRGA